MAKKPRKKFDTGEGNLDMIKNSVRAIKHHADELTSELKKNPEIEAWVLAKVDRAAQNLSDVTHYLDGEMNKFKKGGTVELIFHGSSREIPMGKFESAAEAKRYVKSSDWERPYTIRKVETPVVRTQFEEEEFEYAKGGETKPSLIPDYKKISSVEVEDIDMADYPDFSDAYISYAEYDGEPMTDEQLEELNQDGYFVYDAIQRRLFAKGGKVKRKRWIQYALSGDHKGALRETAKRKGLLRGDEKLSKSDLHKLEKMGGKTARRAHLAETLRDFKK
jgi:hypothetical protein